MVQASASGSENFADFAEDVRDFEASVDDILDEAVTNTAKTLREYVVEELRRDSTAKGGTYDSRTSPYEPGTTNDSSDDNLHITEESAWNITKRGNTEVVFSPREEVRDRAEYIAFGTEDHGPTDDTPMFFQVNGITIVLSESPPVDENGEPVSLGERFDAEPTEVSGVDATMFFGKAVARIKAQNILQRELNKSFTKHLEESGLGEIQ